MLHNTGQFGSDVPLNVNAQNMTSINERMNIDNNLAKISHPVPQSSPHFNIPDYGPYGLNMNANLNPYQNFHPIGFQPSNVPNPMHNSWPSNMLPMNLNMHSDQHMLGYQYGKPESHSDHIDLSLNKNLSVPQVQTKAFHKQMGMDVNYPSFKPHFRQYADYNLHLNAKTKPEVHKMDVTPELDRDIVSSHPYYEQNLDLSNKSQKIYSNPYQSIDSTEYTLSCDKNENGRNVGSYDLSTKIPKYTTVLQKPASTYQEQRDPAPPKSTERDYPDNLSVSKPQNVEQNLTSNYQFPSSDIGNRFLKDQDSRRRSLENTVKMIENILSHSSNTRKTDYYSQDDSMDTDASSKNKSNSKEPEIVSNSNQTDSKPNTPSPSECSNNKTSQESTNISDDKADVVPKNDDENKDNITSENNENTNNDNGSHSDSEDSSDCDIKPSIKEIDVKPENDVPIDNSVVIKVEIFPSIVDMEYLNPFHRDIFGIQNEDVANNDIIDSENSINVAKEVIRNGASVKGAYFECPHCNLYFNHPKRFLIHAKWHSFGLTNEKRLELQKEKERRKTMKKEARVVERMKQSEVTEDDPGRKFNCKECDKVFNSKASLKHHRQRYHPTRARDCKICGKTLIGWMAMRAHLTTHTSETGYQCTDCPKRFKHPHSLAKHKDTHLEKTHECTQCPKKFGSAALLNVHMKTHERVLRGATFRCTYCGKGFFESYSLQVHERTHRNERPYHCEICNTSFGTNSSLKRHVKVSHNNAKPFECSTCHRCFISEAIRDRHEIRNHGNPEDFKFLCKQCPCKYLKLKDLRKHMYKSHPKGKRKKKVESDSDYDTSPPRRRAPKSHAERQRRYILRKKQKRLEEYLKEIKNAGSDKIEPAELSAVTHFLTNPPPRPPPKTHAERQRLYILRKKQKELEEYMKQTQNASGDNPEVGELSAVASNLTNLQPRPPPKSHAERQRRYMIRKKQKMLEEKLKKAQRANDGSCETAELSADTSFTSLPSRTSPKTNAERQRDFRLRQKERKFEENDNKSPKKSRAAYLRQYRAKRKLAAMMNSDFVEVVLREETEASNPETVTTDSLTQLSADTVV